MKLSFFSDIHGNDLAFWSFIKENNSKYIYFLGDFLGYYYNANEIITYCRENKISCVLGNHDQNFLDIIDCKTSLAEMTRMYGQSYSIALKSITEQNIEFMRKIPHKIELTFENKKFLLCHGSPADYLTGRIYPDTDISQFSKLVAEFDYVITGHTHHKLVKFHNSVVFLNPGSLGQQRDGRGCSYLNLDTTDWNFEFQTVDYDITIIEKRIDKYDNGSVNLKEVLRRIR